jgi:hypothetical protein
MTPPTQAILTHPGSPLLASAGPGTPFDSDPSRVLLFETTQNWHAGDMIRRFWQEDFPGLDWLRDYLRDANVVLMVDSIDDTWEEEEDDEQWSKADLQNLENDGYVDSS